MTTHTILDLGAGAAVVRSGRVDFYPWMTLWFERLGSHVGGWAII